MRDLSKMVDVVSKAMVGAERIKEVIQTERDVRNSYAGADYQCGRLFGFSL